MVNFNNYGFNPFILNIAANEDPAQPEGAQLELEPVGVHLELEPEGAHPELEPEIAQEANDAHPHP